MAERFGAERFGDATFDAICTSPTYGNRMADHHNARDASPRHTYRHVLGRPLTRGNSGALQWGDGIAGEEYRALHVAVWTECRRVLKPGGIFVLNVKDHIRGGVLQEVTKWHSVALLMLGFVCTAARARALSRPAPRCQRASTRGV